MIFTSLKKHLAKKQLSNYEKLKFEILKEAQEKIDRLYQNKKIYDHLSKSMFQEPNYPGWINNYCVANSVFCYFIMRDLINKDIIHPLSKYENIQWFGFLKRKLAYYKDLYSDAKDYSSPMEKTINETFIENGGYIYAAFLNTEKDCILYIMIPFLEYIIEELTKKGCFHARINI